MSRDCLFCKIAKKEIPASFIYEDVSTIAFLDIHPHAVGHTMVIPKEHRETILDASEKEIGAIFSAVKKVTDLIQKKLHPNGFTIGINHGKVSGQVVEHLHIHIIPRFTGDGGGSIHSVVNMPGDKSVDEVLRILKS